MWKTCTVYQEEWEHDMRRAEIFPTVSWIDFSKMKLLQNCLWGLLIACFHFYVNTKMQKRRKYKPWVFLGRLISGFPALLSVLSFSQLIGDPPCEIGCTSTMPDRNGSLCQWAVLDLEHQTSLWSVIMEQVGTCRKKLLVIKCYLQGL